MADSKPSTTISPNEIGKLADRLAARADSILSELPAQCADLRSAARLIRALLKAGAIKGNVRLD
jgi:hypothetical protein